MAGTYARETEVLIVGGGPGGYMAAIRLGQLGKKALLVETGDLGGECLNRGCIPSKALLHASGLYHEVRTLGPTIGVVAPDLKFDMATAQSSKRALVAKERQGVQLLLKSAGAHVLRGSVRFTGPHSAELTGPDDGRERIDFRHAIIATGSVPMSIPGFEPDGDKVLTAADMLELTALPRSLLVLGGGVSGCELGEFAAQTGVEVTIVELLPQLLPGLDPDLSRELTSTFEKLGVGVRTGHKATKLDRTGDGVALTATAPDGSTVELRAEKLFLTIGKRAATQELGLEEAGVALDEKSRAVRVDDQQRTNVPHIYAVGDVGRTPMLAHKAYHEGIIAAEVIAGQASRFQFQVIPSVVFTTPEIATVGLTLADAKAQGYEAAREVRFPYAALGRAHAYHATQGWLKIVGDDRTGLLLGTHAAGRSAGEFAAEAGFAIEMGATVRDLALTIHPHPTFSEMVGEAALLWLGEPMHVAQRKR